MSANLRFGATGRADAAAGLALSRCDVAAGARAVADEIQALLAERARAGRSAAIALPTGSTPLPLYAELVHRHQAGVLATQALVAFNLDEFFGLPADHPRSFARFMREHLLDALGLPAERCHIPRGTIDPSAVASHCREYERKILAAGGLDLVVLGIGRNGHVAFNEPGSKKESRTRKLTLSAETRADLSGQFGGIEHVPSEAITMGVATLLAGRRLRLMAFGEKKRAIVGRTLSEAPSAQCPATWLRAHADAKLYTDVA
jgi:glucosamine-6-phosphate deaminase